MTPVYRRQPRAPMVRAAAQVQRRRVAHSIGRGQRDGQHGAHDDDEGDGGLRQAKPEQRQRQPADAGERLQAEHQRSQRLLQERRTAEQQTERDADQQRDGIGQEKTAQAGEDGKWDDSVQDAVEQRLSHRERRWEDIRWPEVQPHQRLPQEKQTGEEDQLRSPAAHAGTPSVPPAPRCADRPGPPGPCRPGCGFPSIGGGAGRSGTRS